LGLRRDYRFPDHEVSFTILADRDRWGPSGLFGGLPGRKACYILNPDGAATKLGSKLTLQLKPGDIVSYRTCGGGGYGEPYQRDPQSVLHDVQAGKIGVERAHRVYGVAIDSEKPWQIDPDRTRALRLAEGSTPDI
jgi:N-methylhydantoinase B